MFRCKASEVEQNAKAIEDNHRNPTPEGDKQVEALRVPKPDNPESKQGYRFDPAKIDWESLKKVGITADTLKNTKDFDRVMRGYKSRNTYTVSGSIGGFYLKFLPQTDRCQALFLSGEGRNGSPQVAWRTAGREAVATPVQRA